MAVRKRGAAWQVDVKVQGQDNPTGQLVRVRKDFASEREALRMELLIRAEVVRTGRWSPELEVEGVVKLKAKRAEGTLKAALTLAWNHATKGWARTKDGAGQRRNAEMVIEFLGENTLCAEITHLDFDRAAAYFASRQNSSDTITRKLQAFYRVLWFAQRQGWIKARPEWDRPTPGKAREYVFTPAVEAEVIAYFRAVEGNLELADMFQLAIETGARLGELLAVRVEDCDIRAAFMTIYGKERADGVRSTKNAETRTVILTDVAKAAIARRQDAVGKRGRLFPSMTSAHVSRDMRMAREHMGEEGNDEFTFHATRHTCGTRMAERGVPLNDMMDQLGHKTAVMTRRYIKLSPAARRATILAAMQPAKT
jgi:integrase